MNRFGHFFNDPRFSDRIICLTLSPAASPASSSSYDFKWVFDSKLKQDASCPMTIPDSHEQKSQPYPWEKGASVGSSHDKEGSYGEKQAMSSPGHSSFSPPAPGSSQPRSMAMDAVPLDEDSSDEGSTEPQEMDEDDLLDDSPRSSGLASPAGQAFQPMHYDSLTSTISTVAPPKPHRRKSAPARMKFSGPVIKKLHVSSLLLASESRFFAALLTNGMRETAQKQIEFQVVDLAEAERVEAILRFLYSNVLPDSWGINELMSALLLCDRLGIDSALSACCSALQQHLSVETCSSFLHLPETLTHSEPCRNLITTSNKYIANEFRDFENLWLSDRFLSLSSRAICAVLKSDDLHVRSEQTVYQAARRWMQHQIETTTAACSNNVNKEQALQADESNTSKSESHKPTKKERSNSDPGAWMSNRPAMASGGDSQAEKCASAFPCLSCRSVLAPAALNVLRCVRLPLCSADFLQDVVRLDQTFLCLDPPRAAVSSFSTASSFSSLSSPSRSSSVAPVFSDRLPPAACPALPPPLESSVRADEPLRAVLLERYLEAREWQGLSFRRRNKLHPPAAAPHHPFIREPGAISSPQQSSRTTSSTEQKDNSSASEVGSASSSGSSRQKRFTKRSGHGTQTSSYALNGASEPSSLSSLMKGGCNGVSSYGTGFAHAYLSSGGWKVLTWRLADVANMPEGQYIFSPSFPVDGYWFRLQAGRIKWERSDGYAFALFLSLDLPASGLSCDQGFFVTTESQFSIKNWQTQQYEPTHLPSSDTFYTGVCELGYFDVLKKSWSELMSGDFPLIDQSGAMELTVKVRLTEHKSG